MAFITAQRPSFPTNGVIGPGPSPGSSTDNALVRWDGTTGQFVQNSVAILTDSGNLSGIDVLTVNTLEALTTVTTGDTIISLNDQVTSGAPANVSSGLEVWRGSSTKSSLIWKESDARWEAGLQGSESKIALFSDFGNLTDVGTDGIVITGGTGATFGNVSIAQHVADSTHNGYLTSTDWSTFNAKQAAGNYITALTGDGTATGPGSVAFTLASVNGNVGSFTLANITVNAKGLVTAASSTAAGNLTDAGTDGIVITGGTGAVIGSGTSIAQHVADSTHNGYLSNSDWVTFNAKQSALTFGNLTDAGTDGITVTGGTGAVIGSGTSLSQHVADSTHNGYLSSTDWVTFNAKQAAGNYITALTGDVTASGPGSAVATIPVGTVTDTKGSLAVKPAITVVATSNQALTGTPTIDGQATAVGSIILLTAQSTGAENGPWVAAAGAWNRPTWYPSGGTTQAFQFITTFVRLGSTYQGSTWRMTTGGAITIDTTATTWVVTPHALNSSTASISFTTEALTGNRTVAAADNNKVFFLNSTGGAFNVTLPAASTMMNGFHFWLKDYSGQVSTNNVTLVRNGSDFIEGLGSNFIFQTDYGSLLVITDGTGWYFL